MPAPAAATPTPAPGFNFHKPKADSSWLGGVGDLMNKADDNIAYIILAGAGFAVVICLGIALWAFMTGNSRRGMDALIGAAASGAIVIVLGTYTGVLQGVYNSVSS